MSNYIKQMNNRNFTEIEKIQLDNITLVVNRKSRAEVIRRLIRKKRYKVLVDWRFALAIIAFALFIGWFVSFLSDRRQVSGPRNKPKDLKQQMIEEYKQKYMK
ncbi:MAG: hypothetical protein A2297_05455 [Elusimicrobia bacterium RIFOXYB2_FULL_48_7]|nr:MAG: hypothetical protein A2297_05455 [Elusimicrobia bacterium RIFOXYB2_FULL_48_7]